MEDPTEPTMEDPTKPPSLYVRVKQWHMAMAQISPGLELQYVEGIRMLELISPISKWSLFGGSGVSLQLVDVISAVWQELYDVNVVFVCAVFAEHDNDKQATQSYTYMKYKYIYIYIYVYIYIYM